MIGGFTTIIPSDLVCEESPVLEYSELSKSLSNEEIYPKELELILGAPQKRQNEFITGRICTRRALKKLEIYNYPVLYTSDKLPLFPETVTGSISHTNSYCAAVLGLRKKYLSIGIDLERISKIKPCYFSTLCTEDELLFLKKYNKPEQLEKAAILFSAKEAFYKLQFQITCKTLYFKDVCCLILGGDSFSMKLLKHVDKRFSSNTKFSGSYHISNGLVFSAMYLCND